jgi:hypothetical protein
MAPQECLGLLREEDCAMCCPPNVHLQCRKVSNMLLSLLDNFLHQFLLREKVDGGRSDKDADSSFINDDTDTD